jgi:hypothetical protein
MAAPRLVVEVSIGEEDVTTLMAMTRSRTEPASRVERARILLAYRANPSFFAVGTFARRASSDRPELRRASRGLWPIGGFGRQSTARQNAGHHRRGQAGCF